jgi:hypothetical protein
MQEAGSSSSLGSRDVGPPAYMVGEWRYKVEFRLNASRFFQQIVILMPDGTVDVLAARAANGNLSC